ncbi:hypothetical protein ANO14919_048240 [Xylariales sp. No.14919]|nr:hypothetical protein ANO14919_048240 [Xylariales sp. No.14919]
MDGTQGPSDRLGWGNSGFMQSEQSGEMMSSDRLPLVAPSTSGNTLGSQLQDSQQLEIDSEQPQEAFLALGDFWYRYQQIPRIPDSGR